jgi:hypothetical protein
MFGSKKEHGSIGFNKKWRGFLSIPAFDVHELRAFRGASS